MVRRYTAGVKNRGKYKHGLYTDVQYTCLSFILCTALVNTNLKLK